MMLDAARALVAKNRTVAGQSAPVSLCDLGYCSVGVDEGWEGCGQGVNGTQHDAQGLPTIDEIVSRHGIDGEGFTALA